MQFHQKLLLRGGGLVASAMIRQWMRTLDYQILYYDPSVDPAFRDGSTKKRIYIFWHEYIPFLLYLRRRCNLSMLLSRHRDADYLEQVAKIFGFGTVRGSTARGGATAILEMMEQSRHSHLTITPDGPRGPRRKLASGCIYLASKLQLPLVLLGLGFQNPWRAPTWDQFAIPVPGTRARAIASPEIHIPPDLSPEQIKKHCHSTELLMNQLCTIAEDWADSGVSYQGETFMQPGPINELFFHPQRKKAVLTF